MSDLPYIIIGGGGHTRVLIGLLQAQRAGIRGILTQNEALLGTHIMDVPVLGLEGEVKLTQSEVQLVNGVGNKASRKGAGLEARRDVMGRYIAQGFRFPALIAPSASVMPHVQLADGVQVMAGAVIQSGATIGGNSIINTRASIDHDAVIAPNVHIAPAAVLCGEVQVGEGTHVGAGAVITQGVVIGKHCVIGAGAIVHAHVPDNSLVLPARSSVTPL